MKRHRFLYKYATALPAAVLCLILCLPSCSKRYEEGPCLSFIKAENRISGRWQMAAVLVDGSHRPLPADNDTLAACSFSFFRNNENAMFVSLFGSGEVVWAESLIRYDHRMVFLTFSLTAIAGYEPHTYSVFRLAPALSQERTWQITKLKRKEMRIKTQHEGSDHEIRFELLFDYDHH